MSALTCLRAWAGGDVVPGSRYTAARAAALGGAYLGMADDAASGLFYNPAGIARIRRPALELSNFQIQVNSQYVNNFDSNFFKVASLPSYASSLDSHPRSFPGVSMALLPTFSIRGFSFGLLGEARTAGWSDGANLRYRSNYQLVPAAGFAVPLASGVVRIGYSLQWVSRATGDITAPRNSGSLGWNRGLANGSAVSHNVGFAVTLPYTYVPSFNFVGRNIGKARYIPISLVPPSDKSGGLPADEPMTFDAGIATTLKGGGGVSINSVLDWRDATNQSKISLPGHLSGGLEFGFRDQFFMRFGIGSGYPSAGIGLRTRQADFHLAWFSEETGTKFRSERDARFVLQYQVKAF